MSAPRTDGGAHVPILCQSCTRPLDPQLDTCTSFPDGIPDDIALFGDSHLESLAGEEPFQLDPAKVDLFRDWQAIHQPTEDI